ncbi:MAG: hypothetical protein JO257_14970 [Deltaproteobacteria bacterium]|nr:hypothetical protein [Deltaproteobacteria bacterium]
MDRLALIERIHTVELQLAKLQYTAAAAQLMRGRSHELGNQVQILKLASLEIERQASAEQADLIKDLRAAAEQANLVLSDMMAAARPPERTAVGPAFGPTVRAVIEEARGVIGATLDLRSELSNGQATHATAEELAAIVYAAMLDAEDAKSMTFMLRERQINKKPWVELLRFDTRQGVEPEASRYLPFLEMAVKPGGGEASLSPGRNGLELAIAFPIAIAQSSSSS